MFDKSSYAQLAVTFQGDLIRPSDGEYDEARGIYNAMIDRRPRLIARCESVDDVIMAVTYGREQGLETAIRGGGHNGPGLSLVDDGLVIDLSGMNRIEVDPEARVARVEAGCRWGEVDRATHGHGLATVSGIVSNTGVPGLTLGGGHGYLTRKYGLTIDNLRAADLVLADGRVVRASDTENPDLFWALRGGGGNFGVVTAFEFQLHPVETVLAGPMFWSLEHLPDVLAWYRDWLPQAPPEIYAFFMVAAVPPAAPFPEPIQGQRVCGLMWCCLADETRAREHLRAARNVAPTLFERIGPVAYPDLQSAFDDHYPPGLQWYWKGDFVREISDQAVAEHQRFAEVPTPHSTMHLYPIDGAVHDVAEGATAWAHRNATWSMVMAGVDPDPAQRERITGWARDYWEALHPHSAGAAYVNFMMEEGADRVQATYGGNYERLRHIKRRYDPHNFFHVNQNIRP